MKISGDAVFAAHTRMAGMLVLAVMGAVIAALFVGGLPAFQAFGAGFLTTDDWDPVKETYGAAVPISAGCRSSAPCFKARRSARES